MKLKYRNLANPSHENFPLYLATIYIIFHEFRFVRMKRNNKAYHFRILKFYTYTYFIFYIIYFIRHTICIPVQNILLVSFLCINHI